MAERDSADHEDLLVRELLSNQEPQRLSPGSAGPEPALGMSRSAGACLPHTQGTSPLSPILSLCSFPFSSLAVPLCSVKDAEAAKLPVPTRDISLPSSAPPGTGGEQTALAAVLEEEDQVCRNGTASSSLPVKI